MGTQGVLGAVASREQRAPQSPPGGTRAPQNKPWDPWMRAQAPQSRFLHPKSGPGTPKQTLAFQNRPGHPTPGSDTQTGCVYPQTDPHILGLVLAPQEGSGNPKTDPSISKQTPNRALVPRLGVCTPKQILMFWNWFWHPGRDPGTPKQTQAA